MLTLIEKWDKEIQLKNIEIRRTPGFLLSRHRLNLSGNNCTYSCFENILWNNFIRKILKIKYCCSYSYKNKCS